MSAQRPLRLALETAPLSEEWVERMARRQFLVVRCASDMDGVADLVERDVLLLSPCDESQHTRAACRFFFLAGAWAPAGDTAGMLIDAWVTGDADTDDAVLARLRARADNDSDAARADFFHRWRASTLSFRIWRNVARRERSNGTFEEWTRQRRHAYRIAAAAAASSEQ